MMEDEMQFDGAIISASFDDQLDMVNCLIKSILEVKLFHLCADNRLLY